MTSGLCSRCKFVLTDENSSPSIFKKGAGYCRKCQTDLNEEFKIKSFSTECVTGLCNKELQTLEGKPRGFCNGLYKHFGSHGNNICTMCGVNRRLSRHSWCKECQRINRRNRGIAPPVRQKPGEYWTFSCGCQGLLPAEGESNKFAKWSGSPRHGVFAHYCRAALIIRASTKDSQRRGFVPIDVNTSHSILRILAEETNCWRCRQPLSWEFGLGKTPHLHHDHKTGEIFGFTHPKCNPQALEDEIDELRAEIRKIRKL